MPNTTHGLPYPPATDPVAQGAAAIEALAKEVDKRLSLAGKVNAGGAILAGTGFTVVKNGTGDYSVTFAPALPGGTPIVIVQAAATEQAWAAPVFLTSPGNAGFRVSLRTNGNISADGVFQFHAVATP